MPAMEIVHIRPNDGALPRLLAIRPAVVAEHQRLYPTTTATLTQRDDGSLIDVWIWDSKALADEALADDSFSPAFQEWQTLVELISVEWTEIIEPV